jgi:hypothetical protein
LTGSLVATLFGLALPWLREHDVPLWPWVLSAILVGAAAAAPRTLRPIYRAWLGFGELMSRITTPVIVGALFFLVVTPIARGRAWLGHDPLVRRFDPNAVSYRTRSEPRTAQDLERPF